MILLEPLVDSEISESNMFRWYKYDYTSSECKTTTKNFWKNLGYKVTIEKNNDSKDSNGIGE